MESLAREISNVVQVPDETKDVDMKDANEDIQSKNNQLIDAIFNLGDGFGQLIA